MNYRTWRGEPQNMLRDGIYSPKRIHTVHILKSVRKNIKKTFHKKKNDFQSKKDYFAVYLRQTCGVAIDKKTTVLGKTNQNLAVPEPFAHSNPPLLHLPYSLLHAASLPIHPTSPCFVNALGTLHRIPRLLNLLCRGPGETHFWRVWLKTVVFWPKTTLEVSQGTTAKKRFFKQNLFFLLNVFCFRLSSSEYKLCAKQIGENVPPLSRF